MNPSKAFGIVSLPSFSWSHSIRHIRISGQPVSRAASLHELKKNLEPQDLLRGITYRSHICKTGQARNMTTRSVHRVPIEPQQAARVVRSVLSGIDSLAKNVAIRDLGAAFCCTVGIGSEAWSSLTRIPKPAELHPFPAVHGQKHTAVSTPGDLLFHIRSERRDLCFEFERQLLDALGDAVTVVDETTGFRYFDVRDLLGFVDGTANPVGTAVPDSVLIAEEDENATGGSYVVVQKYVHDVKAWNGLSTEQQESIIGRKKLDNVELDDVAAGQQQSHKSLATIEDENGEEHDILRDNMPFGSPGSGEFGTYFIGYSRRLWVIERMLQRMFIGNPPGLHDRLLDFSTPLTGITFFAPSSVFLKRLGREDE
ncbi:hypothetical protein F4804DRAFT_348581 [Jackrogersella minutella]|nr:hypothetical protein F4804DRAFT_348581 [Jackrogersella minutella]